MKKILVGLDESPHAPRVLERAVEQARLEGAELVLLHAVAMPIALPEEAYAIQPERLPALMIELARVRLRRVAESVPADIRSRVRVELGGPWHVIVDTAKAENVDLIVIGSHGYHRIDRMLGTTAARVVDHADRSVLVVREP
jgi:nucleotide-binding universal stress UspA family protein